MPDPTQSGKVLAVQDLLSLREDAYRLAVRVSNTTDAEDIVHDAYVRAIQATEIPNDKSERRLWFLRVIVNAAHTHGQNDKSRRVREQGAAAMATRVDSHSGSEQAARNELVAAIHDTLPHLDQRHRSAICLHYEQGLTYDEASKVLDVPAGSLRSYASQGLQELRDALERRGHSLTETALCATLVAGLPLDFPATLTKSVEAILAEATPLAPAKGLMVTSQAGGVGIGIKIAAALFFVAGGATWFALSSKTPEPVAVVPSVPKPVEKLATLPATSATTEFEPLAKRRETPPPPVAMQAPAVAPAPRLNADFVNTPNLIETVRPEENAVAGDWKKVGDDLVSAPARYSRCTIPYHPGESYDLYLEFTRETGVADINVMLPHRGRTLLWKMGAQGNTQFLFKDVTPPKSVPTRAPAIRDGVRNMLLLEVRPDTVTATLNGERILQDKLNVIITGEAAWNLPDQSAIGLGTWQTAARFHRLHVKTLQGTAHAIARDTSADEIAKEEYWKGSRELLSREVKLPNIPDGWVVNDTVATSDDGRFSRLDLNYTAPEEYDLRTEVTRNRGKTDVAIILGRAGKSFCLKLGTWGNFAHALDTVHGRTSGNSPASVNGKLDNGQSYKVIVQVRKKSVKVFLDNKMILCWPTDFNEFTIEGGWAIQSGNIGIGSYEGSATFKRVQIKELSPPPPLKTNAPPASEF